MKVLSVEEIIPAIEKLCIASNYDLGSDIMAGFHEALKTEPSPLGIEVLKRLVENAEIAHLERVPMCQDTGMAVLFVEIGQDLHVTGGDLTAAINEGVRRGYDLGFLRKSVVKDPFERVNTGDNRVYQFKGIFYDGFT